VLGKENLTIRDLGGTMRSWVHRAVILAAVFMAAGLARAEEPTINYYLLGGVSAVGGAKGGKGASAGVVYTDCQSAFCSGYAQFVGHTLRRPGVTYFDTMKGYSLFSINAFAGLGIRTLTDNKLVGQVTYGFGFGPAILSIRRFSENSQKFTEVAFSFYVPYSML
jgi:hypothetical protein